MVMVKLARIAGLAALVCALTAAPARANFFPELTVTLDPPTAATSPTLTAAIAQPATDTPIERVTLNLAAGFRATGAPGAAACSLSDLFASACPPSTLIGTVDGRVGDALALTGT